MKRSAIIRRAVLETLERRRMLSFAPLVNYPTGGTPTDLITGDFNGDTRLDLAATGAGAVLLGNADGTFQPAQPLNAGQNSYAPVVGDVNNDGKLDLITTTRGDVSGDSPGKLNVMLGNGNSAFQPPLVIVLPGLFPPKYTGDTARPQIPTSVVVGDLNNDGKMDLVATTQTEFIVGGGYGPYGPYYTFYFHNHVTVLLGHGNGTFAAPGTTLTQSEVNAAQTAALKEFNNDGKLDLLLFGPGGKLDVRLGNGSGAFGSAIGSSFSMLQQISGDFDNDGKLDLIGGDGTPNNINAFLKGRGDGNFDKGVNVILPGGRTVVGDVNGDGKLDLLAVDHFFQNDGYDYFTGEPINPRTITYAQVLLGYGDGSFSPPQTTNFNIEAGYDTLTNAVTGDFSGDGRSDLATAHFSQSGAGAGVSVARNLNDWAAPPPAVYVTDIAMTEGESGSVNAVFSVTLVNAPAGQSVSVSYATADPGAGNIATSGTDYTAVSGILNFAAGQKTQTVSVPVKADSIDEYDQYFYLTLTGATGGGTQIMDGVAFGTIIDNDALPMVTVTDVAKKETNSGFTPFIFTISLSHGTEKAPGVGLAVSSGTAASALGDFDLYPSPASVYFYNPAVTSQTFGINIYGDTTPEPSEMFYLDLPFADPTSAQNLIIGDGHAVGIILDDDGTVKTWSGPATGGNWSTASNWSPSGVPGPTHDVVINGNVAVSLAESANVRGVTLTGGASLNVATGGDRVLRTSGLAIDGRSRLDLGDNDLIFDHVAFTGDLKPPPLSGVISRLVREGSMRSTPANSGGGVYALGVGDATSVLNLTGSQTGTFSGQTVDSTTVLVKFTYGGDANLDGIIDGDDYFAIDNGYSSQRASYGEGDFDHNGRVDADDYWIIDSNYGKAQVPLMRRQPLGAELPTSTKEDEKTRVPESLIEDNFSGRK